MILNYTRPNIHDIMFARPIGPKPKDGKDARPTEDAVLKLYPGTNELNGEDFAICAKHPQVQNMLDRKEIVIIDEKVDDVMEMADKGKKVEAIKGLCLYKRLKEITLCGDISLASAALHRMEEIDSKAAKK